MQGVRADARHTEAAGVHECVNVGRAIGFHAGFHGGRVLAYRASLVWPRPCCLIRAISGRMIGNVAGTGRFLAKIVPKKPSLPRFQMFCHSPAMVRKKGGRHAATESQYTQKVHFIPEKTR
jgi:hypothetical protein